MKLDKRWKTDSINLSNEPTTEGATRQLFYWSCDYDNGYRGVVHVSEDGRFNWRVMKEIDEDDLVFNHVLSGITLYLEAAQAACDHVVFLKEKYPNKPILQETEGINDGY